MGTSVEIGEALLEEEQILLLGGTAGGIELRLCFKGKAIVLMVMVLPYAPFVRCTHKFGTDCVVVTRCIRVGRKGRTEIYNVQYSTRTLHLRVLLRGTDKIRLLP